jgi:hypothetical protein
MRAAVHRVQALSRATSSALVVCVTATTLLVAEIAAAAPPIGAPGEREGGDGGDLAEAAGSARLEVATLGTIGPLRPLVAARGLYAAVIGDAAGVTSAPLSFVGGEVRDSALVQRAPAGAAPAADAEAMEAPAPGDLRTQWEVARAAREASPSPQTALAEADACEALGDYACAKAALRAMIEDPAATSAQREDASVRLEGIEEASRGRNLDPVAPEPESTHRARIDGERDARLAALNPPPPPAPAPVEDKPERIVRKWYFWVTVAAIGAAAGAITGIAVKAAVDERRDSLDASAGPGAANTMGPALLRF